MRYIARLVDFYKHEYHTICALKKGAVWPVQGLIRHFFPEFKLRKNLQGNFVLAFGQNGGW